MAKREQHNEHNHSKYMLPEPYPELKIKEPNLYYATILQDDYAGLVSEMSALSQYMYHYFGFDEWFKEAAEVLEGIAIVEMIHAEKLGKVITKLGGDPRFYGASSTCFMPWSGSFVKDAPDPKQRILLDIQDEIAAIKQYEEHIRLIDDPNIDALLRRIIKDEEHHIKLFEELLKKM